MQSKKEVHVYGNGRGFVVVPVILSPSGASLEVTPVRRVGLTLGRATAYELAKAIHIAAARSAEGNNSEVMPWDGDHGRWWRHNLIFVILKWEEGQIVFAPQASPAEKGQESTVEMKFPAHIPFSELAHEIIRHLGERLHMP